jgi:hypothetical protein
MLKTRSKFLPAVAMIMVMTVLTFVLFRVMPDTVDATTWASVLGSFWQPLIVIAVITWVFAFLVLEISGTDWFSRFLKFITIFAALVAVVMTILALFFRG